MPQIDALRGAIDDALRRLSPKSAMAKALAYGRKRWDALTRYTEEGMAEIDNNIAERAIRSIAIGRKNWLFAGSKAGGERAAAIYSVIETAKLNGVEPQAYIADVIEKIASRSEEHTSELQSLMRLSHTVFCLKKQKYT